MYILKKNNYKEETSPKYAASLKTRLHRPTFPVVLVSLGHLASGSPPSPPCATLSHVPSHPAPTATDFSHFAQMSPDVPASG